MWFQEDWSTGNIKYHNNKYKYINNCVNDNKNLERSFSSSDSGEDNKTPRQSPIPHKKFNNSKVTRSDIINQNLIANLDDNELNCSSLDTIKVK